MKIGIFAGSFNPIHDGHIEVARMTVEFLELDTLFFMVENEPWGEKTTIDSNHRTKMVKLGIEELENVQLLNINHKKFTIEETLNELEKKFAGDELFFVLGADTFMKMNKKQWPNLENLTEHYLVVFERGIYKEEEISLHAKDLGQAIAILPSPHPKHSSTDVRFSKDKTMWLPKSVSEYIFNNKLYIN